MAWTKPQHSKSQVRKAGKILVSGTTNPQERAAALAIVNNWRAAHSFPLNTMQVLLRNRAAKVDGNALVAQRVKRLPSIEAKLTRLSNLQNMQDLGGCRAVMSSLEDVSSLLRRFLVTGRDSHELVTQTNYIDDPRESGYRSVHLVYAYQSSRNPEYNGLFIEIQMRTQLQHAWATTVETVALFTGEALKASQGSDEWLRFFALMSSAFARQEGTTPVPGTPEDPKALYSEIAELADRLQVIYRLESYAASIRETEEHLRGADYFVLSLDVAGHELFVRGYVHLIDAQLAYSILESNDPSVDTVLVATSSVAGLRSAYPNYFGDTQRFIKELRQILEG